MLKAIIFDLDGVLCSTDRYHFLAWKSLADRLHLPFNEHVNDRLRGVSRMDSLEIILGLGSISFSKSEKEHMAAEKNFLYRSYLEQMGPESLLPGARETLGLLQASGYRLAVGSSSKNAPLILQKTGITSFFDAVSDGNRITNSKPNPEVFLLAAKDLGTSPRNCAVVEDAPAGIQAAKNGGFTAIGIGNAGADPQADYFVVGLRDLPPLIKKINPQHK